jgi:hypothetical protein
MAVSSYKDVNWGANEPLDTNKLNTMSSNSRYLFERAPRVYYASYGVRNDTGMKIAAGASVMPAVKNAGQYITVTFGSFFTPGCRPIVIPGVVSNNNWRIIVTTKNIASNNVPDYRGFIARCATAEYHTGNKLNYFINPGYLHWVAVGY